MPLLLAAGGCRLAGVCWLGVVNVGAGFGVVGFGGLLRLLGVGRRRLLVA